MGVPFDYAKPDIAFNGGALSGIGIFATLCIFIFKGPTRDAMLSLLLLVAGTILFCFGLAG